MSTPRFARGNSVTWLVCMEEAGTDRQAGTGERKQCEGWQEHEAVLPVCACGACWNGQQCDTAQLWSFSLRAVSLSSCPRCRGCAHIWQHLSSFIWGTSAISAHTLPRSNIVKPTVKILPLSGAGTCVLAALVRPLLCSTSPCTNMCNNKQDTLGEPE